MPHIHLIHWRAEEAANRISELQQAGFDVTCTIEDPRGLLKRLREETPAVILIDLSRRPSHGREIGAAIRESAKLRHVPLLFVGGTSDKVETVRELLPDAEYVGWRGIARTIQRAIVRPVPQPIVPKTHMSRYAGRPLCQKLGIREGTRFSLRNPPHDFERTLGPLPKGAVIRRGWRGQTDLVLWFVDSVRELEMHIDEMADKSPGGGLWICWPKQASGAHTDVTQAIIRRTALAAGLVDYKICSVDATWSGLRFTRQKGPELST